MDKSFTQTDWSLIQSFLAVAETGSLSGAARRLGRSQPTLGRQIHALETALETRLFDRHPRGLKLSDTGEALLPMAQQMRRSMNDLTLLAAGNDSRLEGTVRITASVFASHHILPPILSHIRSQEPLIQLELAPSDTSDNLLFREADIAVRMYRPTQVDIIARHLADIELGAFAAKSYLDRAGRPRTADDMMQMDLVGYDGNDLIIRTMRELGWPANRETFAVRCDNQTAYWELIRAGCGIGFGQVQVGRMDPSVEELDLGIDFPKLPVWLAAHPAMRRTPRVRRVWDLLSDGLTKARL